MMIIEEERSPRGIICLLMNLGEIMIVGGVMAYQVCDL